MAKILNIRVGSLPGATARHLDLIAHSDGSMELTDGVVAHRISGFDPNIVAALVQALPSPDIDLHGVSKLVLRGTSDDDVSTPVWEDLFREAVSSEDTPPIGYVGPMDSVVASKAPGSFLQAIQRVRLGRARDFAKDKQFVTGPKVLLAEELRATLLDLWLGVMESPTVTVGARRLN